jgi:protein associated with RNAse G/E
LTDPKWTKVIKEEMDALLKNGTRTLVPLLEGKKLVGVHMGVFYQTQNRWIN